MIGIRFKIPNQYDMFLNKILKDIDFENYFWYIEEDEVYLKDSKELFSNHIYINSEFKHLISIDNYYVIFLNVQLYEQEKDCEIITYEDFIKSNCMLMLMVTDNIFVDVYSKNDELLRIIEQNVFFNEFDELQYIYEGNDERKVFSSYE